MSPNPKHHPQHKPSRTPGSKARQAVAASKTSSIARNDTALLIPGNLSFSVLPRSFKKTLRYAETYTLTTGTAGVIGSIQTMALNSVYDPNVTGTGHQPYGFDQLSTFYNNYIVHGCRWRLLATTIGNTSEVCVAYQVYPTLGGVSITGITVDAATEKSSVSTFNLGPSGNDRSRLVTGAAQIARIQGLTPAQYIDNIDHNGATVGANPTSLVYLEIGTGSYTGSSGISCVVQVILDYDVEFFYPKTLPQS
jgi:hypothetical protein